MNCYKKLLKVATPEGKRIVATISPYANNVIVKIDYLEVVKKDNPKFAKEGKIKFSCPKPKYREAMIILTQYLEDLFLKGMSNEDIHTSLRICTNKGRNAKKDRSKKVGSNTGTGDSTSIHISARGNEQTESSKRKEQDTNISVDESSDPQISSED